MSRAAVSAACGFELPEAFPESLAEDDRDSSGGIEECVDAVEDILDLAGDTLGVEVTTYIPIP